MNIHINRIRRRPETIDGHLYINGSTKICDTAENALHALEAGTYTILVSRCHQHSRKMPVICLEDNTAKRSGLRASSPEASAEEPVGNALGLQTQAEKTCLEGSTLKRCTTCPKLSYVGNNTTMPTFCPMLTAGNGVYKRDDGAILLGEYIAPGCLKHPKENFDRVYQMIRKASERGHTITLTITEDKPLNF